MLLFSFFIGIVASVPTLSSINIELIAEHILPKLSLKDVIHFKSSYKDAHAAVSYYYSIADSYSLNKLTDIVRQFIRRRNAHLMSRLLYRLFNEEDDGIPHLKNVLNELSLDEKRNLSSIVSSQNMKKILQLEEETIVQELMPIKSDIPKLVIALHSVLPFAFFQVIDKLLPPDNLDRFSIFRLFFTIPLANGEGEYFGQLKDQKQHGYGIELVSIPDGQGTKNILHRMGEYMNGYLYYGIENHNFVEKLKYKGYFINNLYDGLGDEYDEHGNRKYNGFFSKGKYHGKGVLLGANGNILMGGYLNEQGETELLGEFKDGLYDIEGLKKLLHQLPPSRRAYLLNRSSEFIFKTVVLQNLDYYLEKDRLFLDTYFKIQLSSSIIYSQSLNGMAHGYGIEYHILGDGKPFLFYKGQFQMNKSHGWGICFYTNGNIFYQGEFRDGQFDGQGRKFDRKGNLIYSGSFKNGRYHGYGIKYTTRAIIIGRFEYGKAVKGEATRHKETINDAARQ